MTVAHLSCVDETSSARQIELDALRNLKEAMYDALVFSDWSELKCLDRVCARMINHLCMKDRSDMAELMQHLSEIKQIYKLALAEMQPEEKKTPLQAL